MLIFFYLLANPWKLSEDVSCLPTLFPGHSMYAIALEQSQQLLESRRSSSLMQLVCGHAEGISHSALSPGQVSLWCWLLVCSSHRGTEGKWWDTAVRRERWWIRVSKSDIWPGGRQGHTEVNRSGLRCPGQLEVPTRLPRQWLLLPCSYGRFKGQGPTLTWLRGIRRNMRLWADYLTKDKIMSPKQILTN